MNVKKATRNSAAELIPAYSCKIIAGAGCMTVRYHCRGGSWKRCGRRAGLWSWGHRAPGPRAGGAPAGKCPQHLGMSPGAMRGAGCVGCTGGTALELRRLSRDPWCCQPLIWGRSRVTGPCLLLFERRVEIPREASGSALVPEAGDQRRNRQVVPGLCSAAGNSDMVPGKTEAQDWDRPSHQRWTAAPYPRNESGFSKFEFLSFS